MKVRFEEVHAKPIYLAEVCLAEVRHAEIYPLQVNIAEIRLTEVGLNVCILPTPLVPGSYALPQLLDVFFICHSRTSGL